MNPTVGLLCRRPEIGDRLALGGALAAVYGQAVGMEGVAGLPRFARSGSAGGAAAQHSVQPTGVDLGRLTTLAAPATDGWRWAGSCNIMGQPARLRCDI